MTMTTLLTSKQTDALRSIGDSAFLLFALWMIDSNFPGRMTTADELLPYLHPTIKDRRKITAQLNSLCASGRLTQTSAGYVLLEGGRALLLGMTGSANEIKDLALSSPASAIAGTLTAQALTETIDAEFSASLSESDARNLRAPLLKKKIEEDSFYKNKSSSSDSSDLKSAQNSQNLRIGNEISHTAASLKVGESAILPVVTGYTFEDGTPVYQMDRGDGVFITTREILDAVEIIEWFGSFSPGLPVDAIKPELALAWIAKGCEDAPGLEKKPVNMVYKRLKLKDKLPDRKYFKNTAQYLPDEYCAELGLIKYDCKSCVDAKFTTRAALEEHVQKMHLQPEAEADVEEAPTMDALDSDDAGSKAWSAVLAALQMEMPRASFDTWVRDTCAVYYDGSALSVGARNQYCRDWLESRQTITVEGLLREILNQPVSISFVVAKVKDEQQIDPIGQGEENPRA
jgi:hypothetical protein